MTSVCVYASDHLIHYSIECYRRFGIFSGCAFIYTNERRVNTEETKPDYGNGYV